MDTPADLLRIGGAKELLEADFQQDARGIAGDWTRRLHAVLASQPELARQAPVVVHGGYASDSSESSRDERADDRADDRVDMLIVERADERAHGGGRPKKIIPAGDDSLLSAVVAAVPETRRHHLHSWHGPLSSTVRTVDESVNLFSQEFDDMGFQIATAYNPFSNYVTAVGGAVASARPNELNDLDSDCGCDGSAGKTSNVNDEDDNDDENDDENDDDDEDEDDSDGDDEDDDDDDDEDEDDSDGDGDDEAVADEADDDEAVADEAVADEAVADDADSVVPKVAEDSKGNHTAGNTTVGGAAAISLADLIIGK